jgi:two-component system nitrogen regulation response regulator GlnG
VRQLENVCHWLTVMAPGQNIDVKDLPPELKNNDMYKEVSANWKDALKQEVQLALNKNQKDILTHLNQAFEKILIEEALLFTKGRRIEAAEMLGLGRNTLTRKVKELRIEK